MFDEVGLDSSCGSNPRLEVRKTRRTQIFDDAAQRVHQIIHVAKSQRKITHISRNPSIAYVSMAVVLI